MEGIARENSHIPRLAASLTHWIHGVYLITEVETGGASDGSDCIIAVNLTRRIPPSELPHLSRPRSMKAIRKVPLGVRMHHHIGGPCLAKECIALCPLHATHPEEIAAGGANVRVIGQQGGSWVAGPPEAVAKLAMADCARRVGEPAAPAALRLTAEESMTELAEMQGLSLKETKKILELRGVAIPDEEKKNKTAMLMALQTANENGVPVVPTIHVYWGDARWSRAYDDTHNSLHIYI